MQWTADLIHDFTEADRQKSPLEELIVSWPVHRADTSFSVFHSNVVSLNRNLENLHTHILHELDFHFNIIGVTETKITIVNSQMCTAIIPEYSFEYVPTPLSSGGVGLFIDESLNYRVLEKISNEAFQARLLIVSSKLLSHPSN